VKRGEELGVEPDEMGVGTPRVSESEQTSSMSGNFERERTPSISRREDAEHA